MRWRRRDDLRWLESDLPGARAAFSTRLGGVSEGPFASLNLSLLTGDDPAAVRVNRHRLAAALGRDAAGALIGHQVHAAKLLSRAAAPDPNPYADPFAGAPPRSDGQATANPVLTPIVQVADCVPLALAGPRGVAMLHGGWRGLAAGIVERGVEVTEATAAAIGPGIGPCCYEVGDEVLEAFGPLGEGIAAGRMLDLHEVARRLLDRAGVDDIDSAVECTRCEPELFFSHRRDGSRTGRQAGLVWSEAGG